MQSLWLLTIKNLKLLLRSRSSALIIIFAPLLIILLLGLSYNTSAQFGLKIGVYAADFNEDANSFIEILEEKEFTITKYAIGTSAIARLCNIYPRLPANWVNKKIMSVFIFEIDFFANISFLNFLCKRNTSTITTVQSLIHIKPCKKGSCKNTNLVKI